MSSRATLSTWVLSLSVFAIPSTGTESPALLICDRFDGASVADRAELVIQFSRSIDSRITEIDAGDGACVRDRLETLEIERRAYCAAREKLGHDLSIEPLDELRRKISDVGFECSSIRHKQEMKMLERIEGITPPRSCDQLLAAYLAVLELAESTQSTPADKIRCARDATPKHASEVGKSCAGGVMSVRAASVELDERVSAECGIGRPQP